MTDETYNGWTNRETWLVNLWLSNDENTYSTVRGLVTPNERLATARDIEAYVSEMGDDVIGDGPEPMGLFADLIGTALARVDWLAVADSFAE